jgi:signal transduction histidine kinase
MWWFAFVGAATTVASALGARERQRFISRRLLRRRVRSQQERVVTEELQRTRQIERSLVEVAANLRQTQDQLEHDVMRRQVLADQLTGAVLKAEEPNRAKSEILARMSHELRTPLNAVIGFSSLIRKNAVPRLTAAEVAYLDRINANGLHLLGLLSDILDISHIEVGRLAISISRVSLARVWREAVEMVQPVGGIKEGVSLRLDVPDESCLVDADPARLGRCSSTLSATP